jgi:acetyl esterase/lipase
VRLVRARASELNIDPQRVGIMGFSAGGHLACTTAIQPDLHREPDDDLVGKQSARPDRVILGYPVVSFVTRYHVGSAVNLIGGTESTEEQRRRLSNELYVTRQSPPAFLFHTAEDPGVPVENSLMLAAAYAREGVPCELHSFEKGPHGVGLALNDPKLKVWSELLINWLDGWTAWIQ